MFELEQKIVESLGSPADFSRLLDSLEPPKSKGPYEMPPHVADNPMRFIRLNRD